jgi:hypothetical protein
MEHFFSWSWVFCAAPCTLVILIAGFFWKKRRLAYYSILSATLALSFAYFWGRDLDVQRRLTFRFKTWNLSSETAYNIDCNSGGGGFLIYAIRTYSPAYVGPTTTIRRDGKMVTIDRGFTPSIIWWRDTSYHGYPYIAQDAAFQQWGFASKWKTYPPRPDGVFQRVYAITIPDWLPIPIGLMLPLRWAYRLVTKKLRKRDKGCVPCVSCGFDLRAHAPGQRCPECGTVTALKQMSGGSIEATLSGGD